jgi:pyrroline-5-carboxylate reductase
MSVKGKRVGFIGGGNMGEALIKGLLGASLVPPEMIIATDVRTDRASHLTRQFRIMGQVLREIAPTLGPQHLLISIAAGVSTSTIRSGVGKEARIIRVMPNTPALVLQGATAIAKGPGLGPDDLGTAEEIFGAVGRVVVLDEELMDAVTGLSGSGPAYVAIVIESLADGGVKMGLDRATAMTLATQTVLGAAQLLAETGLHPGALKDMVSSPGGTTIAGISALEEGGIRTTFIRAVERATLRSRELGRGPA